ncbi:MAG: DEAD/DEAH box helicase, partial [Bacteroidia bacterium]
VIATPGRLIALLQAGDINFEHLQHLVLDEADRMLDMGFFDDIRTIINYLPKKRQTILFSATMPPKMRQLAQSVMNEPEQINIAISKPAAGIVQQAYSVYDGQKEALIKHILKNEDFTSVIIFSSTKENVKALEKSLKRIEPSLKAFHSDLEQAEREEIMRDFKNRKLRILIGTDILSRGIDVEGISLVVNYDAPPDPEDYIHRIGRTARASKAGVAITFINQRDQAKFARIEALMGIEVPKLPLEPSMGEGPVYDPEANKNAGNSRHKNAKSGKPNFRNRRHGHKGGAKPGGDRKKG